MTHACYAWLCAAITGNYPNPDPDIMGLDCLLYHQSLLAMAWMGNGWAWLGLALYGLCLAWLADMGTWLGCKPQ